MDKIIEEGEIVESLMEHPGWNLLRCEIDRECGNIAGRLMGRPATDIEKTNFENGRWRGLRDALSIANQFVINKNRAVSNDDAQGG